MSYIDSIKEKAKADKKTIILPETNDKRDGSGVPAAAPVVAVG